MALRQDGKILGVRMHTDADHGAFFSDAQPSKFKIGLMHSAFACYDIPAAHLTARGIYTNKAPGGVAYRCSFRVTEAMFFQERMVAGRGRRPRHRPGRVPPRSTSSATTTSRTARRSASSPTPASTRKCLRRRAWRRSATRTSCAQQEEARKRGRLLGIGISTMTEPLGAGNSREYDILGIKMFDSAELRVHMTGKAILRTGAKTQGQGHETTWAQIVAHELGIPAEDIVVEEGDTDTAPFGMGTYASRSTPVAGAAVAMVSRKIRAKARKLAAHLLEVSEEDVEWELGRFYVRSAPGPRRHHPGVRDGGVQQHARRHGARPGEQRLLRPAQPHLAVRLLHRRPSRSTRRPASGTCCNVVAVDDCGVRINPMIVEGQIMGGLTEAYAMASMQFITFDADGNCVGSNYMDYLLPTAWETPGLRAARGRHARARTTRSAPRASASAPPSAARRRSSTRSWTRIKDTGVRNIDMPLLPDRVYEALT